MQTQVNKETGRDLGQDRRAAWLERVQAKEKEPHSHEWGVHSGTTDGYLSVYCWCGAWAWRSFSGEVYGIQEPRPEVRTRQFEKRLWQAGERPEGLT